MDSDFMNCSWTRGREAPDDVQYFFYIRDVKGEVERECPHYIKDSGTHVGCYVEDLTGIPFDIYFLVNGTSQAVGIPFFDKISSQFEMMRYSPPVNITATCNHTHCLLTWERPRTQHHMSVWEQKYELDIQQKIFVSGGWGNKHNFPINPRARYTVRIRSGKSRMSTWGPWSEPVVFGFDNQGVSPAYVYVLVVLGTVLGTLVIGFLCKRFLVIQSLFPRIPKIKDKLSDSQQTNLQINWGALMPTAGKAENEEVLKIQEDDSTQYYCWFPNIKLQHGAEITINVTSDGNEYNKILKLDNPGNANTSARNLSCVIYNINFMNCSWLPGPAAPANVKYHLNVWTRLEDGDDITECPHYIYDQAGINVGCHFEQLSELRGTQFFFLLNGTSEEMSIPFREFFPFALSNIGIVNVKTGFDSVMFEVRLESPRLHTTSIQEVAPSAHVHLDPGGRPPGGDLYERDSSDHSSCGGGGHSHPGPDDAPHKIPWEEVHSYIDIQEPEFVIVEEME
ncbi:PREDICTED: granulocyte-macrophage colony-stimulating factor receptor subunit alpha [Chrysochloris asiatica]|uniref:Granulocyte-macrophage colony-stimulating factor receptor subunit alpha n=1 Tax=Chrysochloris asiatica TaxID=185453 RepID=A0A9B0UBS0_CHRAS|nr:PREDICTED: granulocyte-macrophage colony-stimulating factor receptor subunit alpha [Chrysochloris asiatica]